jgi:hypothetical protein
MKTLTAPTQTDVVTSAQRVLPGDLLLDAAGSPVVLVTRARTRSTGRKVTQIEGEWLVQRPAGAPTVFRRSSLATLATYIRRGA